METIYLHGVGQHRAKPASELAVNEEIVYSYGFHHWIDKIEDTGSGRIRITVLTDDGQPYTKRYERDRLVAWQVPQELPPWCKWCAACETYHKDGEHIRS